ncbi:hypothetical protein ASPWEDRAFT_33350 [Aspergillus wentii DTO 134E9]|uniref:Heme oxygenase-like protein n=1 Tax=Aspergillus wentii DTO 134E9 TaxID=1073089 RepID=A0A1L9RYK5_ASPWE|nr:uncharacterized protein ASPWEDRAFT_33350 [Aspergillus wentii DTO 134E9]KAI9932442.1 heme oxygenase [Aspergillus wentii]OJJ40009.1 hypothetical protein ASPWEDRAFT_33350 [Aspergillus wentii DTO 134E9]
MADVDLPTQIRTLIKEPHGTVNRLNTARIPLCLPPQASLPTLYTLGFSRYAEIYFGLEEAWLNQIRDPIDWAGATDKSTSFANDKDRVLAVLRQVYLPELLRSRRLEADLGLLKSLDPTAADLSTKKPNAGSEFRQYIKERIAEKPHLLVSYIWIMYSALFNGGRWIRGLLFKAGPEFWGLSSMELSMNSFPAPLSFWQVEDYERVKDEFRERVVNADKLLTETERQEVLDETLEIFRRCELITLELDQDVAGQQ